SSRLPCARRRRPSPSHPREPCGARPCTAASFVLLFPDLSPAPRVLRDDRVASRVRRRVAERVGGRETPEAFGQVRHRPSQRDTQTSFEMLFVSAALDLDEVGEDRGEDPAMALPLVLERERLAEERQRSIDVFPGASDQSETRRASACELGFLVSCAIVSARESRSVAPSRSPSARRASPA